MCWYNVCWSCLVVKPDFPGYSWFLSLMQDTLSVFVLGCVWFFLVDVAVSFLMDRCYRHIDYFFIILNSTLLVFVVFSLALYQEFSEVL